LSANPLLLKKRGELTSLKKADVFSVPYLWDIKTGDRILSLEEDGCQIYEIKRWNHEHIISRCGEALHIWNVARAERIGIIDAIPEMIGDWKNVQLNGFWVLPQDMLLFYGYADIHVWDIHQEKVRYSFKGPMFSTEIRDIHVLRDQQILVESFDANHYILDPNSGALKHLSSRLHTFDVRTDGVYPFRMLDN